MNQTVKMNIIKMWIIGALRAASIAFLSILSVFFLRNGMTEVQIGFYNALSQIVNLAISLTCSGIAAGFGDSRKALSFVLLLQAVFVAFYAIFCVWSVSAGLFYSAMLIICALVAVVSAIATIFDYKLPCEIMQMEHYSVLVAYSGLCNGIVGTVIGMLLPLLFGRFDFFPVIGFCILMASVCLLLAMLLNFSLRPIMTEAPANDRKRITINPIHDLKLLFSNRDFRALLIPNFLRGVGTGVTSLTALIAIRGFSMSDGDVSLITAATNIGTMLSSVFYVFLVRRFGIPRTGLIGGLIFCLACFSMLGGTTAFLILYGVAYMGFVIASNAMPDMIYQCVDQSIISQFHTWRLALLALGTAVSTPIYGALLAYVPAVTLFVISSAAFLLCTLGYYWYYRKRLAAPRW